MRKLLIGIGVIGLSSIAFGQVGINNNSPAATLDITAQKTDGTTTEGLIPPRLTGNQLKSADAKYTLSQRGTIVYATEAVSTPSTKTEKITEAGLYYFDGAVWQKVTTAANNAITGDIKHSVRTSDHDGWYLMDGRNISSLPISAQANAISLGLTTNLYDAKDRVLKSKSDTENIGEIGGTNNLTITQSNLPNVTLTGVAETDGEHTHEVNASTSASGSHSHGPYEGNGFLLGGTQRENNGQGNYVGVASGNAWGGVGRAMATSTDGNHTHSVTGTTIASGTHTHPVNVNLGGSGTTLDNRSSYLTVNTFIYLGS